ncbi:MAG: hypothetical protein IH989_05305 [Planctomycetes bacterium]|nr:hypothetical protein [Planctomycetota bacterium]
MKRYVALGVTALLFGSMALAQSGSLKRPRQATKARVPATLKLLHSRIPEVAFEEAPFEQVMEWVGEFTQANVVVRWEKLEDIGVDRDKPITLKVRNLRLSQVLWMIMNEAGGSDVKLAYRAAGNMLVMSTEEDLSGEMIVRVYDVSDLLANVPRFTNASRLDPAQSLNQLSQSSGGLGGRGGGGGGGGGGQSQLFETGQNDENDEDGDGSGSMAEIVQLITDTVEPDSWVQGGGLGTIQPFRKHIVVRNTLLVHQRLGGYVSE